MVTMHKMVILITELPNLQDKGTPLKFAFKILNFFMHYYKVDILSKRFFKTKTRYKTGFATSFTHEIEAGGLG